LDLVDAAAKIVRGPQADQSSAAEPPVPPAPAGPMIRVTPREGVSVPAQPVTLTADELRARVEGRLGDAARPPRGAPHWSVASLPALQKQSEGRTIPRDQWTAAARRRQVLERRAVQEGSQDWRTADL